MEYNRKILQPSVHGFTESKSKHFQAHQDAHKFFVDLLALSVQLVFVKRAGGFPNQADSAEHTQTHTSTNTNVNVQSLNACFGHGQGWPPYRWERQIVMIMEL